VESRYLRHGTRVCNAHFTSTTRTIFQVPVPRFLSRPRESCSVLWTGMRTSTMDTTSITTTKTIRLTILVLQARGFWFLRRALHKIPVRLSGPPCVLLRVQGHPRNHLHHHHRRRRHLHPLPLRVLRRVRLRVHRHSSLRVQRVHRCRHHLYLQLRRHTEIRAGMGFSRTRS